MFALGRRRSLSVLDRHRPHRFVSQKVAQAVPERTPFISRSPTLTPSAASPSQRTKPQGGAANDYLLPRNDFEQMRLNFQHSVVTRQFGGLLPPGITIGPGDKILEAGCGTGIWSLQLAATLPPTVSIHSTDISPANFPLPSYNTPSNVHFSTQSVLSLPESWSNTFSVIHQRLFSAALSRSQWRTALAEHYRVLLPGGVVALTEIDGASCQGRHAQACPAEAKLTELLAPLYEKQDMIYDMQGVLRGLVEESGLEVVSYESKVFSKEGGIAYEATTEVSDAARSLEDDTLMSMVRTFESFWPVVDRLKLVDEETYHGWLQEMRTSWREVPKTKEGRGNTWVRICARKPF